MDDNIISPGEFQEDINPIWMLEDMREVDYDVDDINEALNQWEKENPGKKGIVTREEFDNIVDELRKRGEEEHE